MKIVKKYSINLKLIAAIFFVALTLGLTSCSEKPGKDQNSSCVDSTKVEAITPEEIATAQRDWANGIVHIGQVYVERGNYKQAATDFIKTYYNYQEGIVLFKPTKAAEKQFRLDFQGALSYFVAGDSLMYPEDHGFALEPWKSVRFENVGNKIIGNTAMSMGNYYFQSGKDGKITKVEYSFGYTKDRDGKLRIILHDSHLPYVPKAGDPNL